MFFEREGEQQSRPPGNESHTADDQACFVKGGAAANTGARQSGLSQAAEPDTRQDTRQGSGLLGTHGPSPPSRPTAPPEGSGASPAPRPEFPRLPAALRAGRALPWTHKVPPPGRAAASYTTPRGLSGLTAPGPAALPRPRRTRTVPERAAPPALRKRARGRGGPRARPARQSPAQHREQPLPHIPGGPAASTGLSPPPPGPARLSTRRSLPPCSPPASPRRPANPSRRPRGPVRPPRPGLAGPVPGGAGSCRLCRRESRGWG